MVSRIVVAVTGASGAIYAVRLLKACLDLGMRIELIASDYGKRLLIEECDLNLKLESVHAWLDRSYGKAERPGSVGKSEGTPGIPVRGQFVRGCGQSRRMIMTRGAHGRCEARPPFAQSGLTSTISASQHRRDRS